MRETLDELGKFFARLFVLFSFLNSIEMTIGEEWTRILAVGFISFVLMFEWFSKRTSLQMFEVGK